MEYWNMHTYSNKVIDSSKISLLKDKDEYSTSKILKQLIDDNILYVKQNLDFYTNIITIFIINYNFFVGCSTYSIRAPNRKRHINIEISIIYMSFIIKIPAIIIF
ncbi:MAG: hypothetical protein V8R82_08390 [Clostridia bacterium]